MRTNAFFRTSILAVTTTLAIGGCGPWHHKPKPVPPYWVTDLGPLPGGKTSQAMDINDRGQVVGRADFGGSRGHSHAVLWESGKPALDLGTLDGGGSAATRISPSGHIVGWASANRVHIHAVAFNGGKLTDIGKAVGETSMAFGVDDAGRVVATANTPTGAEHGYLLTGGKLVDLGALPGYRDMSANDLGATGTVVGTLEEDNGGRRAFAWKNHVLAPLPFVPGYNRAFANAVNGREQITGACSVGSERFHAVLWDHGQVAALAGSPDKESQAMDLNDAGEVVGQCNNHACLWRRGKLIDLNDVIGKHSETVLHEAVAINNSGQIVCNGAVNKQIHAYLLTPTARRDHS